MDKLYRLLLWLYPARFREEYLESMEVQFNDECRAAGGGSARVLFWGRTLRDLAASIPAEIAHEVAQDLRVSARAYARRPVATALAVIALAMAIGVTTGVFSVLNGVMFRSLPFREPERLVRFSVDNYMTIWRSGVVAWGEGRPYFSAAAEYSTAEMSLNIDSGAARVQVTETSSNFFHILGVEPVLGRAFMPGEEGDPARSVRGVPGVAVIGYGLWQQRFGGDPGVLGLTVRVNGVPLTVVGVAPPAMDFPERTGLWAPGLSRFDRGYGVVSSGFVGRLKPGLTLEQARALHKAEFTSGSRNLEYDDTWFAPLRDKLAGPIRRASTALFAAVLLGLLIACANVAQLLLSRTNERRQELCLRAALGASRARLLQQLVTEATALTLAGAALGLPVAWWTSLLAARIEPAPLAAQAYALFDWRVLAFMGAVSLLTGGVFGVLPALAMRRGQPSQEIIRSQPGAASTGAKWIRISLIAGQAALTMVLLAGCIVMGRSFLRLVAVDLGFRTDHVVTMRASVAGVYDRSRQVQFFNAVVDRLRGTPGVQAAGAVRYLPLIDSDYKYLGAGYRVEGGNNVAGAIVRGNAVTDGYFRAMGIGFLAGRDFTGAERTGKGLVAIVDDQFARQSGLGAGIVGRTISLTGRTISLSGTGQVFRVVGLVPAMRLGGPAAERHMQVYVPLEQAPPGYMTFVARISGSAGAYLAACQAAAQKVDPKIPIYDPQTLDERLSGNLLRPRYYTAAVLFLGVFALLLAAIGIYGAATYSVTQRTHEIGVRIAIGAAPGRLRGTLVREGMVPVIAGMAAGAAGAMASGRVVKSLMESAEPLGMPTCVLGALVLGGAAFSALWFATSRVIRMDPMAALKTE
jgi:putative ABC transport system permease protein